MPPTTSPAASAGIDAVASVAGTPVRQFQGPEPPDCTYRSTCTVSAPCGRVPPSHRPTKSTLLKGLLASRLDAPSTAPCGSSSTSEVAGTLERLRAPMVKDVCSSGSYCCVFGDQALLACTSTVMGIVTVTRAVSEAGVDPSEVAVAVFGTATLLYAQEGERSAGTVRMRSTPTVSPSSMPVPVVRVSPKAAWSVQGEAVLAVTVPPTTHSVPPVPPLRAAFTTWPLAVCRAAMVKPANWVGMTSSRAASVHSPSSQPTSKW